MFGWFTNAKRRKLMARPFKTEWDGYAARNIAHWCMLDESEREELRNIAKVLLGEKYWEGCGGLTLTDEIKVTIALQAGLLILGVPHDYYRNVLSILVYPSTVWAPPPAQGFFQHSLGPVDLEKPVLGQAFHNGPVILVWDAVLHGGRHPEKGHNVVYHEFAHKLDMLDGAADGTPPLHSRKEYADWIEVCSREFLELKRLAAEGHHTFLDHYGATDEAEFFAVATEQFFDQPLSFLESSPRLYEVLSQYYRQDPAARAGRQGCAVDAKNF